MQASATLITSLVYSRFPGVEFADLVDALDMALGGKGRWDGESNAIFEVQGSRVVVGFEDHRPQPEAYRKLTLGAEATLVLSIGSGPDHDQPSPLEPHRHALLSTLAERINRTYPCDLMLWSETEEVFEPTHYAPLVSLSAYCNADVPAWQEMALPDAPRTAKDRKVPPRSIKMLIRKFHTLNLVAAPEMAPVAAAPAAIRVVAAETVADHRDLSDTFAPANSQQEHSADLMPQVPAPVVPDLWMVQPLPVTLQAPMALQGSLPQRLTIYAMNATLMLVALPVGCAVLVYNMVRGEDLGFSARAIAVTGTLVGLAQLAGLPNAMYLV